MSQGHFLHCRIPGLFFGWILLVVLVVSRVDFVVFVLFLEAVGVREYCRMAVDNWLAALCFARSARATRARARRTFVPASWWLWACSRKLRSWSCTQPRAAKATAGVAICWQNGIDTARCCRRVIHAAGERS